MKKTLLILCALATFALWSCKANYPVAQESGKEDVAYLLFVSTRNAANKDVDVTVDNATTFKARTVKSKKSNRRGTQYSVQTGKRRVKVLYGGAVLYDKFVFLSSQETKVITLP